jgi:hypothetical protein
MHLSIDDAYIDPLRAQLKAALSVAVDIVYMLVLLSKAVSGMQAA